MDRPDLGAGQHGKDDLRHTPHVDGDAVASGHAHSLDDVRHAAHFAIHGVVGIGLVQLAVFALPDERQLVLAIGLEMSVDAVMNDIYLRPREPLVKRLIRIVQHLVPFLEPFQFFCLGGPEALWIFQGTLRRGFPVLEDCLCDHFVGWIVDLAFHHSAVGLLLGHHIVLSSQRNEMIKFFRKATHLC